METYRELLNGKNVVVTGRAATGIYLILKNVQTKKRHVLLPANICYAAVFPVVYAGFQPVFCDVDVDTGNATLEHIRAKITQDVSILILPHMYGNPVSDIDKISDFCLAHSILLIEDCASSMGASVNGRLTGIFGDYCLYSMGYSKTLDLGNGGLIVSKRSLEQLRADNQLLPLFNEQTSLNQQFFSRLYRFLRNNRENPLSEKVLQNLGQVCHDNLIYRLTEEDESHILASLPLLEEIIPKRRGKAALYDSLIDFDRLAVRRYKFTEGAVPWRYNLFLSTAGRAEIIEKMLERDTPVSD